MSFAGQPQEQRVDENPSKVEVCAQMSMDMMSWETFEHLK